MGTEHYTDCPWYIAFVLVVFEKLEMLLSNAAGDAQDSSRSVLPNCIFREAAEDL